MTLPRAISSYSEAVTDTEFLNNTKVFNISGIAEIFAIIPVVELC